MVFQAGEDENKKKQNRVIMVIDYSKSSSQPDSIMSVKVPLSPKWQEHKKPDMDGFKDHRLIKLSKGSQDIYNKLSNEFKDWKTRRKKLVETLRGSTKALERNSAFVSSFRILTTAADMFGNLTKNAGRSENSRAAFLMGSATAFGVGALLVEKLYYSKALNDIERAISKDRESYKKCIQWYEETKELDKIVKSIFPYDIDTDIAQQINKGFTAKNDYEKVFMAILASNGKRNLKLLRDEEFLKAANFVATSEAGKLWYHKTISKDVLFFESDRYKEVRQILRLFQTEDREVFLESCKSFWSKVNMKIAIDVISIISCLNNILYGARSDASEIVEKFVKSTEEECKKLQKIVSLLKPPEVETDRISQEYLTSETEDTVPEEYLTSESDDSVPEVYLTSKTGDSVPGEHPKKLETLSSDFKDLLSSGSDSDVILDVQGKEFRAHRAVLSLRSPVFRSMFEHDFVEARSGVVQIPDCDPDSFGYFLQFLYTGNIEDVPFLTAYHMYTTAKKYNVQELEDFCAACMKQNLTVDNVCDVILLADIYDDSVLMSSAQTFFYKNFKSEFQANACILQAKNPRLFNRIMMERMDSATLKKS